MVTLAIILNAIGLLILPLGRLYAAHQVKKGNNKFSDSKYVQHFRIVTSVVSLTICGIAILIIYLMINNTK